MARWDSDLLQAIQPKTIRAYLSHRGWEEAAGQRAGASTWIAPARVAAVAIPDDPELDDYVLRIRDALLVIADVQSQTADAVLDEVLTITSDVDDQYALDDFLNSVAAGVYERYIGPSQTGVSLPF